MVRADRSASGYRVHFFPGLPSRDGDSRDLYVRRSRNGQGGSEDTSFWVPRSFFSWIAEPKRRFTDVTARVGCSESGAAHGVAMPEGNFGRGHRSAKGPSLGFHRIRASAEIS